MKLSPHDHLSVTTLFRTFWGRITITWSLTFVETALFAFLPLLIGRSIDGLLNNSLASFQTLIAALATLLVVSICRRLYDTRAYGTMRVELGKAQFQRAQKDPVSVANARVLMGRELVDFLETQAPQAMAAFVQVIVSILILMSFHMTLALSTGTATVVMLLLYWVFANRFFRLNADLNAQSEQQVSAIESANPKKVTAHFLGLRKHEVRISDTESLVYGLIFFVLLTMLVFNLWFAATQSGATPGQIFSIVSYSYEFIQAAVTLPFALQALTRLKEITQRINRSSEEIQKEDT